MRGGRTDHPSQTDNFRYQKIVEFHLSPFSLVPLPLPSSLCLSVDTDHRDYGESPNITYEPLEVSACATLEEPVVDQYMVCHGTAAAPEV